MYVGRKGVAVCEQTGTISWRRVLEPEHDGSLTDGMRQAQRLHVRCLLCWKLILLKCN
jgi:hypothetical protein